MRCLSAGGKSPRFSPPIYGGLGAILIGDVTVGEGCSFWYHTVVRGDLDSIWIGENTNLQEGCVVHTDPGISVHIGSHVVVGHGAIIHGATIEDEVLVGIRAVVLNRAHIGRGSIIGAGAVVLEDMEIPPFSLVVGVPAKIKTTLDPHTADTIREHARSYRKNAHDLLVPFVP